MSEYIAPLKDMQFALTELIDLDQLLQLPGFEDFEPQLLISVLEQSATFSSNVLSPLNRSGDLQGSQLNGDEVVTPQGWRDAYSRFAADGWTSMGAAPEYGGQGLPTALSALAEEMWNSANVAFSLAPMLTRGAIEAIELAATDELKTRYLPNMVSGRWTGTMNLTEPQAGSDLAAVKTRAIAQADGSYRIVGQKIFITYGEHDLTENIVHMVLARTPTAPAGVRGISLFLVPKFLVKDDGSLGTRNDVHCISIEHKLGIHASPTCVMAYGSQGTRGDGSNGAVGWLIGAENHGLEYMFVMMNAARFSVGVQGIGVAERAYQHALKYAQERRQGADATTKGVGSVAIIQHPDVRRMLLTMKSGVEAMRALAVVTAVATDAAQRERDPALRQRAQSRLALLIPVVKGWCTESAVLLASLGIQVQGGMGYIEETGAAQYLRDARILPIYEGTTGIQALDLVGRKLLRDGGQAARQLLAEMRQTLDELNAAGSPELKTTSALLRGGIDALDRAVQFVVNTGATDLKRALAGAAPLLRLFGIVCGGWQMARAALIATRQLTAGRGESGFYRTKLLTGQFYGANVLSEADSLAYAVTNGAGPILDFTDEQF